MAGNSNSGRNPLPGNVHVLTGNRSKKSAADLAGAADGAGLPVAAPIAPPTCPSFLGVEAKAEWKRIAKDLEVMGLLSRIDRSQLAVYCVAWADWKMAREKLKVAESFEEVTPSGYKQMSVWLQIANRAEERMRVAGALFGLNPSARTTLKVRPPQQELFPNAPKEAADKYF